MKESELRAQCTQNSVEYAPDNNRTDCSDDLPRSHRGGSWGYSNPATRERRG